MFNRNRTRFSHPSASLGQKLSCEVLEDRAQPVTLGAASSFGVLSINGGHLILNSSHLVGNVGLGPNGTSTLQKTDITGQFIGDPSAQVDLSKTAKDFLVSGGITFESLSQAQADANAASASYAALAPTQSFGNLTTSITITATQSTNVITIDSLAYNSKTLTFSGTADQLFVVNVAGGFTFADSKIVLTGGVTADHVIFNFPTAGPTIQLYKSTNVVNGTFLAPNRSLIYHNPASFTGALIAQNLNIHSNANLTAAPFTGLPPSEGSASLSGFVYFDANQDIEDGINFGIQGVAIQLYGFNDLGEEVIRVTYTDNTGAYSFAGLRAGTYSIIQTQPEGFNDGKDYLGSLGGMQGDDEFAEIRLGAGDNGVDYIFTEQIIE